jgi:spore coat protein U-like protein
MKKIFLISACSMLFSIHPLTSYAAGSITANSKTTATLAATCTISAQNVNFGAISLPVGAQSASSQMSVQCSNKAPYTISLAYGGIYGQGVGSGTFTQTGGPSQNYLIPSSGGMYYCTYTGTVNGQSYTIGDHVLNGCPATRVEQVGTAYSYGKIVGTISGDSIGYSIQVPNNPGTVWNNGVNNYSSTGTGSTQNIPIVATLIPSQTTNQYPTADNYTDIITATINY